MVSAERKPNPALTEFLSSRGHTFEFFAAVQLLHRLQKGGVPSGYLGPVEDEPVRFRQSTALIFHSSDIRGITFDERQQATLESTFLGLVGAVSPLATHFSEDLLEAEQADQPWLRAFYDLFHHRVLGLFFRARTKYHLSAGFRIAGSDLTTKRLLCLAGVDGHGAHPTSGLSAHETLEIAPLLAMRARPARVLLVALRRFLPQVPAEIEPFVARRAPVEDTDRFALGRRNHALGVEATLGSHVLDRSARFRLKLGPVDFETCESLMPGGKSYPKLRSVVEHFTYGTLECEVDVLLTPEVQLGYQLGRPRHATLGVNARLGSSKPQDERSVRFVLASDSTAARARIVSSSDPQ